MIHPVTNRPEHKRSFIPSLIEKEKVSKMVHAIKMGWIKPRRVEDDSRGRYYDLWANEDSSILAKHRMHLPAPKIRLPGHHESYNPPPEYLFTEEEVRRLQGGRLSVRLSPLRLSSPVCPPVSLSAASCVGAAGPGGQEAPIYPKEVLEPPPGSRVPSLHSREVRALPRPLPVSPAEEDEGETPETLSQSGDAAITDICLSLCRSTLIQRI